MSNGSVGAEGRPRVVDRRGKGIVAIGIESFADVVARHVYVDKTMVIADLLDRGGVTLFCRPRRFGKSLMLRTLQCYFEAPVEGYVDDAGPLFEGLAVMDAGDYYTAERGAHPVVYLGLNACGGARQRGGTLLPAPNQLGNRRADESSIEPSAKFPGALKNSDITELSSFVSPGKKSLFSGGSTATADPAVSANSDRPASGSTGFPHAVQY